MVWSMIFIVTSCWIYFTIVVYAVVNPRNLSMRLCPVPDYLKLGCYQKIGWFFVLSAISGLIGMGLNHPRKNCLS